VLPAPKLASKLVATFARTLGMLARKRSQKLTALTAENDVNEAFSSRFSHILPLSVGRLRSHCIGIIIRCALAL